MRRQQLVIDVTGSVCIYILKKWRSGQMLQITDSQTLKDGTTQLPRSKSGAHVTQFIVDVQYHILTIFVGVMTGFASAISDFPSAL